MQKVLIIIILFSVQFSLFSQGKTFSSDKVRKPVDTIGFARYAWQMDSIINRIQRLQGDLLEKSFMGSAVTEETLWKAAICPHDDYSYCGYMYPLSLFNVQAKTLILFGVCHKAKQFGLENKLIFDSFTHWEGPYGRVKVSGLRDEILKDLTPGIAIVHDSAHQVEHSLEALIPFLQYYNPDIEIIPILVPYMQPAKMDIFSQMLAQSVKLVTTRQNLNWGADFAFILSTDAVHYGDQDWGGKKYDWYGTGKEGYLEAKKHEDEIIQNTLAGDIRREKLRRFYNYTVDDKNYKESKWTWCGRYSIPFGLWTVFHLQRIFGLKLEGRVLSYSTSIENKPVPVDDLKMGVTAPASLKHWVGYVSLGYE
ncbi:MAG: AmmeMemoRadiSam system protein B [Bacteroidales bacterium]